MTKGFTKREIKIIFEKLANNMLDLCHAQKEVNALVDKLFEQDTYNYYQCHKCTDECDECEPNYNNPCH